MGFFPTCLRISGLLGLAFDYVLAGYLRGSGPAGKGTERLDTGLLPIPQLLPTDS